MSIAGINLLPESRCQRLPPFFGRIIADNCKDELWVFSMQERLRSWYARHVEKLGHRLEEIGDLEEAIDLYLRACAKSPGDRRDRRTDLSAADGLLPEPRSTWRGHDRVQPVQDNVVGIFRRRTLLRHRKYSQIRACLKVSLSIRNSTLRFLKISSWQ